MAAERTATDATLPLFLIHRVKFASIYALIIRQQNRALKFLQGTMLSPGSLVILPERLISRGADAAYTGKYCQPSLHPI